MSFDPIQFAIKVRQMRIAQKEYFRDRISVNLQKAKDLEREVDAELSSILKRDMEPERPVRPTQTDLFS